MNDDNNPRAKERLRRAIHNFIAGSPLVAGELAKLRVLRDLLPKRLEARGVIPPEIIASIRADLDAYVAEVERDIELAVIDLGRHKGP